MSQLLNKTFYLRTASGIGLLVIVLGCVLGSPFTMLLLTLTLTAGAMIEFYRIGRLSGVEPLRVYPILIGILLLPVAFLIKVQVFPPQILLFFLPLLFGLFLTELYRNRATPISNIAWEVTGILYVAVPMALLTTLPLGGWEADSLRYSPLLFLSILFMVWANDVGAYLFGVLFGHRKLFPRISPNKSWEGFFGGVCCAIGTGALLSLWQEGSWIMWAGAGGVIALSGVVGDLVESMMKRSVQIKDSGRIMPGHGGFLDRFDALFLAVPFVYTYFALWQWMQG